MRMFFLVFCLFSFSFSECEIEKLKKNYKVKMKEGLADIEFISNIIKIKIKEKTSKYKYKNLSYEVTLVIDEKGKICYYPIKKSNNEEYNEIIENFIKEENGKIYYNDPILRKMNITFKPF